MQALNAPAAPDESDDEDGEAHTIEELLDEIASDHGAEGEDAAGSRSVSPASGRTVARVELLLPSDEEGPEETIKLVLLSDGNRVVQLDPELEEARHFARTVVGSRVRVVALFPARSRRVTPRGGAAMSKSSGLAALAVFVIGCSGGEPPEHCRTYAGQTADLTREVTGLTRHHDRWLDQWLSNEPGPPDTEQLFRERCLRVATRFSGFAADLARAGADSPVGTAAERAQRAAGDLRTTCMDLAWDSSSELGQDRAAREARLRSATDALRDATNAARRACGAPEVE